MELEADCVSEDELTWVCIGATGKGPSQGRKTHRKKAIPGKNGSSAIHHLPSSEHFPYTFNI